MSKLLDANGNPVRSGADRPLNRLLELGFEEMGDKYQISRDTLRRMLADKQRDLAMASGPSTPRWMFRTMGGAIEKGNVRFPSLSFEQIRDLRERSPLLAPIHQARQYQIRRMAKRWSGREGDVGYRIVHRDFNDAHKDQPEHIRPFIRRFEDMLAKPSVRYNCPTAGALLSQLEEDTLTINRPTVEVIHSAVDPRMVVQFRAFDGSMLWPTLNFVERYRVDHPGWAIAAGFGAPLSPTNEVDLLSEILRLDLVSAEYVLVQDAMPLAAYKRGKFLVEPIRNRTDVRHVGFPPSHVEQALHLISCFIGAFDYNASLFTRGMIAEMALGVSGDLHPDDLLTFAKNLRESTQGSDRAWQPPIIHLPSGGAITQIPLKQNPKDVAFESLMSLDLALTSGIYRMDVSTIGAKPWGGGGGPSLSEGSRTEEIGSAREEGLEGDLQHLTDSFLTPLAQRCHPDLICTWYFGHQDPQKRASVYEVRSRVDMTRNQVRLERGDPPNGYWLAREEYDTASDEDRKRHDDNLWNMPADPGFVNAYLQQNPPAQPQGAPPAQPTGDGFGGQDDGFGGAPGGAGDGPGKAGHFPFGRTDDAHPPDAAGGPPPAGAPPGGSPAPGQEQGLAKGGRGIVVHVHDL